MYLELFKLHELPFRLSPDPQFLYLSKQHAAAKAYMESTIWLPTVSVVITGEIGAGKTTLIETFLRELQTDAVVAQISNTLSPADVLFDKNYQRRQNLRLHMKGEKPNCTRSV